MYRSVTILEHLMIEYEDQMNQALTGSTINELLACMTECIRRNRTNMFKVIVGHYRNLQGIQPRVEVEYENEENDNIEEANINDYKMQWRIIDKFAEDVTMNRDYLHLLILSVAYGRLLITRYLVEMLQLEVNKSLLQLFMKVLEKLWNDNCQTATPVYEYLANKCEGKPNLLHLCIQAECYNMLKYLIKEKKLDPNEVDSENGWNAGHYFVSDPNRISGYKEFTWLVEEYKMDCFGVYDRNGRSILHFMLENGLNRLVKFIINHKLGLKGDNQPWYELDLEKIEKYINELQQIIGTLPENIPQKTQSVLQDVVETLVSYLANGTSAKIGKILDPNIGSNLTLESVIQQQANEELLFQMIMILYFDSALENKSIFVLKYFTANNLSILHGDNLWKCAIYAVLKDYKIEFKYFFELYCSRNKIKDFQSCSIENDESTYSMVYLKPDTINKVHKIINSAHWAKLGILSADMIDANILSLLGLCVATVRPSMLRYLKESRKLNLCSGIVYSLAMITDHLFSKIHREATINPSKAYECLLDLASNISDVEANKMLRLAITSKLYEFSNCLLERYHIDFQAVDELKGWNVFHLCASNQRPFWAEQIIEVSDDDDDDDGDDDDDDDDDDGSRASYVDYNKTDLFRYMLAKASDMDCFGVFDKKRRSILHLAMENGQIGIVDLIVARKLGLNDIKEIRNLSVDAIPNVTFCFHAIHKISKSVGEKRWHYIVLCMLAKQIAKISLNIDKQSQEPNRCRLLLQENAKELYEIAMKGRSLFMMCYLHREFPDAILPPIYDADWLACTVGSLRSPYFLAVTKWMLNPNEVYSHANLYEIVEKCDGTGYDFTSVSLEVLVTQVETMLSANRSVEEVCKLKFLALAVCLKQESMIKNLCEALKVNIDWKVLIDIMVIAHQSYIYEWGTKITDGCAFEKPDFDPIYKYLFERITNLGEIDAEGANVLHLAAQKGLRCMATFLIKHNMVNVMTVNEQNGWNIFHYYASIDYFCKCCYSDNDWLLPLITKQVLQITSYRFPLSSLTERRRNKIKELCFNSNEERKSVIHVAVEADNIWTAEYIIKLRLGINGIDKHVIRNSDECSHFKECYDELSQIAAQLPFDGYCDYLLHRLTKSIHRFLPENIEHIMKQGNVENHIVEDTCRSAIKYRSVTILKHLMVEYEDQMNQALARSTNNELLACMTECIRRNRTSMFKVIVGHYRNLQGIEPSMVVEFEIEENDNIYAVTIDEYKIQWRFINNLSNDVAMNRDYLHLLILSVAYGRLSMTLFLVEMLLLQVNKSLILLIMKVLKNRWDQNCVAATPVYEYLAGRCEGNPNLLHLCIQAECYNMLKYLIKEKNLDPNEVDSENGWNAGHYFVSDPNRKSYYMKFTWLVETYNMDCLGVYDRNGRSIIHLAIENGHDAEVKFIINHRLGLKGDNQPWYEWDLEKIEKQIYELQQTLETLQENISQEKQLDIQVILEKVTGWKTALTTYKQLFKREP